MNHRIQRFFVAPSRALLLLTTQATRAAYTNNQESATAMYSPFSDDRKFQLLHRSLGRRHNHRRRRVGQGRRVRLLAMDRANESELRWTGALGHGRKLTPEVGALRAEIAVGWGDGDCAATGPSAPDAKSF